MSACMLISHKDLSKTIQVYSVTVMTHALAAGQSSQGTSESVTPAVDYINASLLATTGKTTSQRKTKWACQSLKIQISEEWKQCYILKGNNNTIQVYSVAVVTHVKVL